MKRKAFVYLCSALSLLALISFWLVRSVGTRNPSGARSTVERDLLVRMASLAKPALAYAPALPASSAAAPTAAPANPGDSLSEAQLAPLRRAFSAPRIAEDPAQPRDRQALLANRLLVSPSARLFPPAASGRQSPTPRNTTPFVVQFNAPVSEASRQALAEIGATVRGFFPNQALLAELTPEALARLPDIGSVQAAAEYLPSDKVQPFLSSLQGAFPDTSLVSVTLQTFAPEDAEGVAAAVRNAGGEVTGAAGLTRWGLVRATLPLGAIGGLAARGEVQWIEERPPVVTLNDQAAGTRHLNVSNVWLSLGLTGKGQVVGHADTGLDTGVTNTIHADFRGNIRALIARGRPGDASDRNGHGTHTAGSILGNGANSSGQFKGIAWEAQLVHQSVVNSSGAFTGLPADLYELYAETYAYGAAIHSDSWGSDTFGAYDSDCRSTDLFAWDNPDHLAVFAAGNSGRDADADGVVDAEAIASPGAAKNVLTVGAAEGDRPINTGGYTGRKYSAFNDGYPYYTKWFPANPIYSDYISFSATTSSYRQGMAAFSSRGPTQDGRIKPDVVAPGTDIISCRSSLGGTGWGLNYANQKYCYNGGTSMSTPLTAGSAALMRQYAMDRVGITNPSAALIKAMLVGGARSLSPGQYGTGATREIPAASPNSVEGWGQPDLSDTVCPTNRFFGLFDRIGPSATGQTNTFFITVTSSNTPLDVALVWTDYPATAGAAVTRVNDLDLLVVAPDGTRSLPNGGTGRDALNTVETVRLPATQEGTYQIHVVGYSVPYAGGAAALYVRGMIAPVLTHTPMSAQLADALPEPTVFLIQPLGVPTNLAARVFWSSGTAAAPTGEWHSAEAAWATQTQYKAQLPAQPAATTVHYYLQVDTEAGTARLPQSAPAATFSFYVDSAVDFEIAGSPYRVATVTPAYGTNTQIKNVPVHVYAPAVGFHSNGFRLVCAGWNGTGDVPPTGTVNSADLVLAQPSSLTWLWQTEFALTNRFRLADTGALFGETVLWYAENSLGASATAFDLRLVGTNVYAFCGWRVEGARWPDATSAASNPATGIPMPAPRLAVGDYLPFWLDSDGNQLSDWWELRYFGTPTNSGATASNDPDHDSWSNLTEFLDNTDPLSASSYPTPPAITVHPLSPFQPLHPPWTIRADITDNLVVQQALLVWREKGASAWQTNTMTYAGNSLFETELNPPSRGAKRVDYFVAACDFIGYYSPSFAATSAVYSVIGDYDYAWMAVSPDTLGVIELSSAPTNLNLTVSNLAGPDLLWTAHVAFAEAPFAATNAAWSHSGDNDVWCLTTNRTWNGESVWYCGNPILRQYPNACHAMLDTPAFRVGADGGLLWRQWIKTEPDTAPYFWDGAVIRISTDGGATFEPLVPTAGYPYLITPNTASPFPAGQPCLAGTGEGWQTLLADLSDYAGRDVIVRFEFGSDRATIDEGWYVGGVTPFSADAPATAWLTPQGKWGGVLASQWSTALALLTDPNALAFDDEAVACIRVAGDDPDNRPLVPLTVRRGHRLSVSATGPGTATADHTFLFRNNKATLTLKADTGAYLYAVTVNGIPQPGVYTFNTTSQVLTFSSVTQDQTVEAWFAYRTWTLTVTSDFGTPTPAIGSYTLTHGSRVDASVHSPIPLGSYSRLACAGWVLSGHSPKLGLTNQLSFALTNDASLVWLWQTNHWLSALAGSNGSLAPTGCWYTAGQTACITSYPANYYHLVTWIGDTDNSVAQGNLLTVPMTRSRIILALFSENLTPGHQVPERWLAGYGWTNGYEEAAEGDADADGMATWQEWYSDTDPTNALSLLMVTDLVQTNGTSRLTWAGGTIRTQLVQQAASPAGPWQAVHTNLPPTPITNTLTRPAGSEAGFYRVTIP